MARKAIPWLVLTWIFMLLKVVEIPAARNHPPPDEGQVENSASEDTESNSTLKGNEKKETETPEPLLEEKHSTTSHSVLINGRRLNYQATAGTLLLKEEDGTPKASFFFIAYTKDEAGDVSKRPLCFAFNGGPGSSSVWLHLGALGPKRIKLQEGEFKTQAPPYSLVNNDYSILDFTDLVFIDPVSTGYSRAVSEEEAQKFHEVRKDIESVGEFIRLYLTRQQRWNSPKFLIGESYGTTRAVGLAEYLQDRHGIYLNGLVLVSVVLNFQTISFDSGNDLPYVLFLPSYTAAAWYHHRLGEAAGGQNLSNILEKAERFARNDYARALLDGASLQREKRQEILHKMARYTGLSAEYIEQNNLRVPIFRFVKELLRDQNRTIGRFDSRFTGPEENGAGEVSRYDPSYTAVQGIFTATLNSYVRSELDFEADLVYEILNSSRVQPWDFGRYQNRYLNMTEALREVMVQQPDLKVFFANGYYDLATPYLAAKYTIDHLELDPTLRKNVLTAFYPAGHMIYLQQESLAKFKKDLSGFFRLSLPEL